MAKEIILLREKLGSFDTIFLGGGNPLSLSADALLSLLSAAGKSRETTIETNPETWDDSYIVLLDKGLVNRISMGVQSLEGATLRTLGRTSTLDETRKGVESLARLRQRYQFQINYDLITCVPRQTLSSSINDIDRILSLSPCDHISLYCLTVEEGTAMERRIENGQLRQWNEDEQADRLFTLWDHLGKKGFEHYEISNFAKGGCYSLHNLHYWHLDPYVGLGSHSAGRMRSREGTWVATFNTQDLHHYAKGNPGEGYAIERLSRREEIEEYLIGGLRIRWGIDKQRFQKRFSKSFDELFSSQIVTLPGEWYVNNREYFALTKRGMMVEEGVLRTLVEAL